MKKIISIFLKTSLILVIIVSLLEIISFFLLKFDHIELFSVKNYKEKTNDNRIFTLKKDYDNDEMDHLFEGRTFSIITSSERLRISKKNNLNIKDKTDKQKFLFIGDSVPFGYGLDAEESLPFYFQNYNKDLIVFNGAIPAYSIAQTVERYNKEFKDIKNIKYIYLHVSSPAQQYGMFGVDWQASDSWTFVDQVLRPYHLTNISIPYYGDSFFLDFVRKKIVRRAAKKKKLQTFKKQHNKQSDIKFVNHLNLNLDYLYNLIKNHSLILILSPISTPKFSAKNRTVGYKRAIKLLNKTFSDFSLKRSDVLYFDVSSELNINSKEMFLDYAGHLSKKGAELMAKKLTEFIKKNNNLL